MQDYFYGPKVQDLKSKKGEPLGTIGDPYGTRRVVVLAPREGYVIGHTNAPVVGQGDALFHIGF